MSEAKSTVEYRDIQGYPGYLVGSDGTVLSRRNKSRYDIQDIKPHHLKLTIQKHGYRTVSLYRNGKSKTLRVHILVLEAFVGPCPEGMECCHFPDRDPSNNKLGNLQWNTGSANQAHRAIHGTDCNGEKSPNAKLTSADVVEVKRLYYTGKFTYKMIAKMFGVSAYPIARIIRGQGWKHLKDSYSWADEPEEYP